MTTSASLSNKVARFSRHLKTGWLVLALNALMSPIAVAQLSLEQLWVRAMPPTQTMTAAYGQLSNLGAAPLTITGVSSTIATETTLHESRQVGDRMTMVAVTNMTLAPGEVLELKPGGLHLMLMGIKTMPVKGSEVEICVLSGEDRTCATASVQRDADSTTHHHH
ncbi:MAG: copper chaperone PCu(A)C [Luminiphilus sp.]|jgi:copper(I)-binding protein|nr:copper chaperone PCu(A)C [Luminiphilus sp.]MDG1460367.1 copper chaperone PCu(A)C [Luminiphilus sp.]